MLSSRLSFTWDITTVPFYIPQLCGIRGGGNAAAQSVYWQVKTGFSFILAFESERERNAAIMLARRFAFDCNVSIIILKEKVESYVHFSHFFFNVILFVRKLVSKNEHNTRCLFKQIALVGPDDRTGEGRCWAFLESLLPVPIFPVNIFEVYCLCSVSSLVSLFLFVPFLFYWLIYFHFNCLIEILQKYWEKYLVVTIVVMTIVRVLRRSGTPCSTDNFSSISTFFSSSDAWFLMSYCSAQANGDDTSTKELTRAWSIGQNHSYSTKTAYNHFAHFVMVWHNPSKISYTIIEY